jgi:hypothetical protein
MAAIEVFVLVVGVAAGTAAIFIATIVVIIRVYQEERHKTITRGLRPPTACAVVARWILGAHFYLIPEERPEQEEPQRNSCRGSRARARPAVRSDPERDGSQPEAVPHRHGDRCSTARSLPQLLGRSACGSPHSPDRGLAGMLLSQKRGDRSARNGIAEMDDHIA